MSRARGVFLALLVISGSFAALPLAGLATASSYEEVVGGSSEKYMHVKTGDFSAGYYDVTVYAPHSEIASSSKDSGWRKIYDEDGISTSSDKDSLLFGNFGAYTEVKIKVTHQTSSGTPTFGTGRDVLTTHRKIGFTGSDADLKCSFEESFGSTVFGSVTNVDCKTPVEKDAINISQTDENETHVDAHQEALTLGAQSESFLNSRSNYLQDVRNTARIQGKNAYIRALENGSSEAVATQKARNAVFDYYTRHQVAILQNRDVAMEGYKYLYNRLANESTDKYYPPNGSYNSTKFAGSGGWKSSLNNADGSNGAVKTATLLNGSNYNYTTYYVKWSAGGTNRNVAVQDDHLRVFTGSGQKYDINESQLNTFKLSIDPPQDNYNRAYVINVKRYISLYNDVQADANMVADEVDTYVNSTYDEWQSDKINSSDLVDPYLGARQYGTSNGSFQSWALRSTQSLGVAGPDTLDATGSMDVVMGSQTYTGILLSDGLPQNDTFQVGTTYNPSNITGPQFVVTDDRIVRLDQKFTLESATASDGSNMSEVVYRNVTYQTQTLDEYKSLMEELTNLSAEIESRENVAAGGGGSSSSGLSNTQLMGIGAVAVAAAAVMMNNGGGRYRGRS
jgi:hypothetical protein